MANGESLIDCTFSPWWLVIVIPSSCYFVAIKMNQMNVGKEKYVLYPSGGAFNQLREQQAYLTTLLEENVEPYYCLPSRKSADTRGFVRKNILDKLLPHRLKVYCNTEDKIIELDEDQLIPKVMQNLRDRKKSRDLKQRRAAYYAGQSQNQSQNETPQEGIKPATVTVNLEDSVDRGDYGNSDNELELSVNELRELVKSLKAENQLLRKHGKSQGRTIQLQREIIALSKATTGKLSSEVPALADKKVNMMSPEDLLSQSPTARQGKRFCVSLLQEG